MAIINTKITTADVATTVYSSTNNSAITTVYLCNTSSTATSANVFVVPNGSSPGPVTQIYSSIRLAGEDTYVMEAERLLLENGDSLRVEVSTANVVTVTVSYTGI